MSKSKEMFMQVREAEMNEFTSHFLGWDACDADHFYYQYQIQTIKPNK
mgnify:CR=1 FL=1